MRTVNPIYLGVPTRWSGKATTAPVREFPTWVPGYLVRVLVHVWYRPLRGAAASRADFTTRLGAARSSRFLCWSSFCLARPAYRGTLH
jgi:hypothetical protein